MKKKDIINRYLKDRTAFEFVLVYPNNCSILLNEWITIFFKITHDIFPNINIFCNEVYSNDKQLQIISYQELVKQLENNISVNYFQCYCDLPCFFQFENGKVEKIIFQHKDILDTPIKITFTENQILVEIYTQVYSDKQQYIDDNRQYYYFGKAAQANRKTLKTFLLQLSDGLKSEITDAYSNFYSEYSSMGINEKTTLIN